MQLPPGAVLEDSGQGNSLALPPGAELETAQPQQPAPVGTIRAADQPTNIRDRFVKWADNVANDIKYGTDITGVGTVLKKMGAHGVYSGNSEAVGDFMASLPLGLLRNVKGQAEVAQGQFGQGTKDIAGGALQAATIPASFMAPEAAEATASAPGKAIGALRARSEIIVH